MRIIYTFLLFSIFFALCNPRKANKDYWQLPAAPALTKPSFLFEYGESSKEDIKTNSRFVDEGSGGFCILSLPTFLYYRETGARFKICLPIISDDKIKFISGLSALDLIESTRSIFNMNGHQWSASEKKIGSWRKDHKDETPIDFWSDNQLLDGTISFSRFDVPAGMFYRWSENDCEVLIPSRLVSSSRDSSRVISIIFNCQGLLSFKNKIVEKNNEWLNVCQPKELNKSESFRHSDSVFGKFLEWENDSDEVVCPILDSIGFLDSKDSSSQYLSASLVSKIKTQHKLVLPHSAWVLKSNDGMSGINTDDFFLNFIGKAGGWLVGSKVNTEFLYNFKQGDGFFSQAKTQIPCAINLNYYISSENNCISPGLPNNLGVDLKSADNQAPFCKASQIILTEYFPETQLNQNSVMFLEWRNLGEACDLSSLNIIYQNEEYPISAKYRILEKGEVFLISREDWVGWPFQTVIKPLSTKQFKFQIPEMILKTRGAEEERKFISNPNEFVISNIGGVTNRSMLWQGGGKVIPHPNLRDGDPRLVANLHISPGWIIDFNAYQFIKSRLSEVLLAGTNDGKASYPERFIEWESGFTEEGYVQFEIAGETQNRYIFYKEKSNAFPFLYSGEGRCLPKKGYLLPEGSLPITNIRISLLDEFGNYVNLFYPTFYLYDPFVYQAFGQSASSRISLHPEQSPFKISFSKNDSQIFPCAPFSSATPGFPNSKINRITSVLAEPKVGQLIQADYLFLKEPSLSSTYKFFNVGKSEIINPSIASVNEYFHFNGGISTVPNLFLADEIIFLEWEDPLEPKKESLMHRQGAIVIEGVYPSPMNSQNEWVYLCNHGTDPIDLARSIIEDEFSSDIITAYASRFPAKTPSFRQNRTLVYNESILNPGGCAFLVDPDGSDWFFPIIAKNTDLLLTVTQTGTIGNGISNSERIDLYFNQNMTKRHVGSYGKRSTSSSFQINVKAGEYSLLDREKMGNYAEDFKVFRELE